MHAGAIPKNTVFIKRHVRYFLLPLSTRTKCIATKIIHNTKFAYMFCIQSLYKPKFFMIMNVQEMYIKFLTLYTKI